MPDQQNDDNAVETGEARLPEPTRAPARARAALEDEMAQQPALSDDELQRRQDALGTKRKPAGPQLDRGPAPGAAAMVERTEDVPETDVSEAPSFDPEDPEGAGGGGGRENEPLESSE
ncbi:MAG TPA: hypothetical protein VJZ00_06025 [Thermoanaerobaculia bacterium]|nr:hypothetical protein [Thermoanaerobaculia bacterium]